MSDDTVIRVENLGKLYRIGETLFYKSLRETITDAFINFFGRLKKGSLSEKRSSKYFWGEWGEWGQTRRISDKPETAS